MLPLTLSVLLLQSAPAMADLAARVDAYIAPYLAAGHVNGQLLIAQGDSILVERHYGLADPESGISIDATTRFAVASVSKPLTLIAAARLVDEGRFSLADTLARWLPDFPSAHELLVLDLANHTAGVPHRVTTNDEEFVPRTAAEMVERIQLHGLESNPQRERRYSSGGYAVLARVLELAAGEDYETLMHNRVFAPVHADHSLHPSPRSWIPHRAVAMGWHPNGARRNPVKDLSFLVGGGSIYSSARDLLAILRGVVGGVYGATAQAYVIRGRERFGWNGTTAGYSAFVEHDSKLDLTWIYLTNLETGFSERLRNAVPNLAADESVADAAIPSPRILASKPGEFCEINGSYRLATGSVLELRCEGPDLFANDWQLFPLGQLSFFCVQDYGSVSFLRDASGHITRMDWDWGGAGEIFSAPRLEESATSRR